MKKDKGNLDIKQFVSSAGKNQYVLISNDEAAVIDITDAYDDVSKMLSEMGISLKYLLITHAHKSHLQALPLLKKKFGGTFCLHEYEHELLKESDSNLEPDLVVKDNATLKLGDIKMKMLLTAGHTKGSVCFYVKKANALFSGSTLLKKGYGRIWGPSSMSLMLFSLKRLSYTIPAETTIYTGNGELTTMRQEGWIDCLRSS